MKRRKALALAVVLTAMLACSCTAHSKEARPSIDADTVCGGDTVYLTAMRLIEPMPEAMTAMPVLEDPAQFYVKAAETAETQGPDTPEEESEKQHEYTDAELEMLACVIYQEAGGDAASDECRYMVGDIVLNRIADDRYPNTMEGVLTEKFQYGAFYWTGIRWPDRAYSTGEAAAVQRAYEIALALLEGTHSKLYGAGYIFQAEFVQGIDVVYKDGLYFGR